ncbi:MAG: hypothetical protein QM811_27680 [Pirellulales bacterium]
MVRRADRSARTGGLSARSSAARRAAALRTVRRILCRRRAPEGKGDGPYWPADGTWGWDYFGKHYHRRVALGWWHQDARQEPGTYKTDGPKILHKE